MGDEEICEIGSKVYDHVDSLLLESVDNEQRCLIAASVQVFLEHCLAKKSFLDLVHFVTKQ